MGAGRWVSDTSPAPYSHAAGEGRGWGTGPRCSEDLVGQGWTQAQDSRSGGHRCSLSLLLSQMGPHGLVPSPGPGGAQASPRPPATKNEPEPDRVRGCGLQERLTWQKPGALGGALWRRAQGGLGRGGVGELGHQGPGFTAPALAAACRCLGARMAGPWLRELSRGGVKGPPSAPLQLGGAGHPETSWGGEWAARQGGRHRPHALSPTPPRVFTGRLPSPC